MIKIITKKDIEKFKLSKEENSLIGMILYENEPVYIFISTTGEKYLKQIISPNQNYDATRLIEILVNEVPFDSLSLQVLYRITNEELENSTLSAGEYGQKLKSNYITIYDTHMSVGGANMERVAGLNYEIAANHKLASFYKGSVKRHIKPSARLAQKKVVSESVLKKFDSLAALTKDKLIYIKKGEQNPDWLNSAHSRAFKNAMEEEDDE